MKFTKEFIDSQIKLYANATPGIWSIKHETNVMCGGRSIAACGGYRDGAQETDEENKANAEFISAAHMHYVDALAEIKRLREMSENWVCPRLSRSLYSFHCARWPTRWCTRSGHSGWCW